MEKGYRLIRSSRRTLCLEIARDGSVLVRAPYRVSQGEIDAFVASHRDWILAARKRAIARAQAHPLPTPEQEAALRRRAREILPAKVAYYAEKMGVQPTGLKITGAQTRFGSCSPRNSLCFSYRLMEYPEEAIDYVVVHELAHILEHNHSPAFYAVIARILPDHKRRRALLKNA